LSVKLPPRPIVASATSLSYHAPLLRPCPNEQRSRAQMDPRPCPALSRAGFAHLLGIFSGGTAQKREYDTVEKPLRRKGTRSRPGNGSPAQSKHDLNRLCAVYAQLYTKIKTSIQGKIAAVCS